MLYDKPLVLPQMNHKKCSVLWKMVTQCVRPETHLVVMTMMDKTYDDGYQSKLMRQSSAVV